MAAGDALEATVEFCSPVRIAAEYGVHTEIAGGAGVRVACPSRYGRHRSDGGGSDGSSTPRSSPASRPSWRVGKLVAKARPYRRCESNQLSVRCHASAAAATSMARACG
jgi:hypothetical protein